MRIFIVLSLGILLFSPPISADDLWAGRKVMPSKPLAAVKFGAWDDVRTVRLNAMVFPVVAEGQDWLRIRDPGANDREGYVRKADFVLLSDAPTFYSELMRQDGNGGFGLYYRAVAWRENGELDQSMKDCNELIQNKSGAVSFFYRAEIWTIRKDYDRAIKDYDDAIQLDPNLVGAFDNRGSLYAKKKDYRHALVDYDHAIRLDPKIVYATGNKAYLLATCADAEIRDIPKAEELLKTVIELREESPYNDELMSVIAAAKGRFADAIHLQKKALGDKDYAALEGVRANERLRAYEQKKPWLE